MSAGGGGGEGDVELNIAPIVDCFTVLIAYMLVSMSFIQLSIFEAEAPTSCVRQGSSQFHGGVGRWQSG
ncbi:hypothetical protein EB061_01655 [bacterium]|nr:hypothetical protein [bacterium]